MKNLPSNFKDILLEGYKGYSTGRLESLFNPRGSTSLSPSNPYSILSELNSSPQVSQADREFYELSLIGPRLNGFTSFEPSTDSNGDRIGENFLPRPDETNRDGEKGTNYSARNFKPAY